MRTVLVGMVSGLIALVGLAGTANASATVELIWQSTGDDTISGLAVSDLITLDIVLTAGTDGSNGGSVSIDFSALAGVMTVWSYSNAPTGGINYWGLSIVGLPTNPGDGIIHHINAGSICFVLGSCLADTEFEIIGTVTFRVDVLPGGPDLEILVGLFDGADGVGNAIGGSASPTFSSSFAVVPEPGTLSLLSMGLGGLYMVGRRSNRKR